jgi:uncharacterized protein DUF4105
MDRAVDRSDLAVPRDRPSARSRAGGQAPRDELRGEPCESLMGGRSVDWPALRPYEARVNCAHLRQASLGHRWFLLAALLLATCIGRPAAAEATKSNAYVEQVVQLARAQRLASDEQWIRLVHYRKTLFGNWESEADGGPFFNAAEGKSNPEAELEATVRGFFGRAPKDPKLDHPICRFPARFSWLHERLHFELSRLPRVDCAGYKEFMSLVKPQGLTLVFSSYYLNNPASAFGHTFLRIDQSSKAEDESRELLDYGVDYSANVDTGNAILYAMKGLLGLFPGTFHRMPFFYKVREYSDYESRDLWQYDLALSKPEVDRVVDHIWELGSTYFAYYYLTENCSYHMLAALEVASPRLHLLQGLRKPVIPADTVKILFKNPGLVRSVKYRPSNRTKFRQRMAVLTSDETDAVALIMRDPAAPFPSGLTVSQQVKVLDTAVDLIDVELARDTVKSRTERDQLGAERQQALLERRASYDVQTDEPNYPAPRNQMPHLGHGSQRLGLGSGYDEQRGYFHSLAFRLALHDLGDSGAGYPDGSEIEFLPMRLRYYVESPKLSLEELSLIRVKSLTPLGRFSRSWSWMVEAGSHRNHDRGCDNCYTALGRFGAGLTVQPFPFLTFFALGKAELNAPLRSGYFDIFRLAIGPYGGARARISDLATLLVTGQWAYLPGQTPYQTWDLAGQLRINYLKDFALGAEGRIFPRTQSLEVISYMYF